MGRFLTQDRYEAADGDLNLQVDPLTQNRYAFAGGNPVSNVEFDGHHSDRSRCGAAQPSEDPFAPEVQYRTSDGRVVTLRGRPERRQGDQTYGTSSGRCRFTRTRGDNYNTSYFCTCEFRYNGIRVGRVAVEVGISIRGARSLAVRFE